MQSADPLVTIIVPVRDGARYLSSCLGAVSADPCPEVRREVVVADNGSTDGSTELARSLGARVVSLPGVRVSALRNGAAREARGELLAFIDVDHQIAPGWLSAAVTTLADAAVVAAGAPYHAPANPTWVQVMYDAMRDHPLEPTPTRWLGSGNLVVRRKAFDAIGGFDPNLEACEDVDLCRRLQRGGGQLVSHPRMISRHLGDPPTLWALFRGELWRGRDNLRVSLRRPIAWRDVPSIVVPMLWLIMMALGVVALLLRPPVLVRVMIVVFALLAVASITRAIGIVRRGALAGIGRWLQALTVALVYDVARGLSLLGWASHRTRHPAGRS